MWQQKMRTFLDTIEYETARQQLTTQQVLLRKSFRRELPSGRSLFLGICK